MTGKPPSATGTSDRNEQGARDNVEQDAVA
jgi:hypothetical protein